MRKAILVLLICLLVSVALGSAQAAEYAMRELSILGTGFNVRAMNDSGEAVGWSHRADGGWYAILWNADGTAVDAGTGFAHAINSTGQIVIAQSFGGPIIRNKDGSAIHLPAGDYRSLNDDGHAAGWEDSGIFWSPETLRIDVPKLPGDSYCQAVDMNNSDQIAGISFGPANEMHPFTWTRLGGTVPLTMPLGMDGDGYVRAINDSGQILGTTYSTQYAPHDVIWNPDGSIFADLGVIYAVNFNNVGQIATSSIGNIGWVWDSDGTKRQLPVWPGTTTSQPIDINDSGSVLGYCEGPDGRHIVVWDQVPEPSSLLALGSGLLGLVGVMRRRK